MHLPGLATTDDDACNRAMDWLRQVTDTLEKEVFWSVATLLDLEVDLLFFDTTSTYLELDEPDEPLTRDKHQRKSWLSSLSQRASLIRGHIAGGTCPCRGLRAPRRRGPP